MASPHSVDRVLASFLGQLVHSRSDISKAVSALYDEYLSLPNTIPPLKIIFNTLKSEISSAQNAIFIVIDALDEFSSPTNDGRHQHLLEQLEKLQVPILVTSRKLVPFADQLPGRVRIYAEDDEDASIKSFTRQQLVEAYGNRPPEHWAEFSLRW